MLLKSFEYQCNKVVFLSLRYKLKFFKKKKVAHLIKINI